MTKLNFYCVLYITFFLTSQAWAENLGDIHCPEGSHIYGSEPPTDLEKLCKKEEKGHLIPHGPTVEWYINGDKHRKGQYKDGNRDGQWVWWYPNGKKMQELLYKDGRTVRGTLKQWNEKGDLLKTAPSDGGIENEIAEKLKSGLFKKND